MAMFENISEFFKRFMQNDKKELLAENPTSQSKDTAKDRLHVVLMQDRANVSADFLEMMKEEIIEVIKKYIVVDESKIDVRLTNEENDDGSLGAPLLHANIPILNVRNDLKGNHNSDIESEKIEGQQEMNLDSIVEEKILDSNTDIANNDEENDSKPNIDGINAVESLQEASDNKNELIKKEIKNLVEEIQDNKNDDEISDEELEDDDDVTFDDLLKAAEEEEKKKKTTNRRRKTTTKKKITSTKKKIPKE